MRKLLLSVATFLSLLLTTGNAFSQGFTDVAQQAGLNHVALLVSEVYPTQGGAAWFDYNNDGKLDMYLTGGKGIDKFYKSNGDGTFTDKTAEAGFSLLDTSIYTMGVITGDVDNDGDRDVFITTDRRFRNYLFVNNGDGTFTDISVAAGISLDTAESASAAFGDYNKDGYLDIFVSNWCVDFVMDPIPIPPYPSYPNFFYINNGDNTFTNKATEFGMVNPISASLGVVFSDYDMDGDADILVANDFGQHDNEENELFQNQYPVDTFLNISDPTNFNYGMNGMGMAVGDYDEDGDFDYYITNMKRNVLMRNDGGSFTNVTDNVGLDRDWAQVSGGGTRPKTSWGTAFLDYDHDTYLDLYEVNGDLNYAPPYPSLDSNMLYRNNGDGTFSNVTVAMNVGNPWMSRGFAAGDYDDDGDLDFLVPCLDSVTGNHNVLLCRNDAANGNWLKVNTTGTISNRDGYGAIITAVIGNRRLIREVDGGSSFISHNSTTVHFGLGNFSTVDSLIILWPSGIVNVMENVTVNQTIAAIEDITVSVQETDLVAFNISPNPFRDELTLTFQLLRDEKLSISLTDITGRKVNLSQEQPYKKGRNTITLNNLPSLSAGVYMLSIDGVNTRVVRKVVRE